MARAKIPENQDGKPYLSIVVTARNDNYGYNFLFRAQNFLDNLVFLCEKYKLPSELIFVEWNPPKDRDRMWKSLKIPGHRKFLRIRFIEVPLKVHRKFNDSEKFPLFEYIGKNVGIRRAEGDFVLITNPDLIFNGELVSFLSRRLLKEDCFYRAYRFDMEEYLPEGLAPGKAIDFCRKNWRLSRGVFFKGIRLRKFSLREIRNKIGIIELNARCFLYEIFNPDRKYLRYGWGDPAGDFTMMSKESWLRFWGFPEFTVPSNGVDGYGIILAAASGLKMIKLGKKLRIYHQFHERPFSGKIKWDMEEFIKNANKMLVEKKAVRLNGKNWGLAGIRLKEKRL